MRPVRVPAWFFVLQFTILQGELSIGDERSASWPPHEGSDSAFLSFILFSSFVLSLDAFATPVSLYHQFIFVLFFFDIIFTLLYTFIPLSLVQPFFSFFLSLQDLIIAFIP